jgi:hypothetical protein
MAQRLHVPYFKSIPKGSTSMCHDFKWIWLSSSTKYELLLKTELQRSKWRTFSPVKTVTLKMTLAKVTAKNDPPSQPDNSNINSWLRRSICTVLTRRILNLVLVVQCAWTLQVYIHICGLESSRRGKRLLQQANSNQLGAYLKGKTLLSNVGM